VKVKPLTLAGVAGLVFRYHTNRHYYLCGLEDGKKVRLALHLPIEPQLRVAGWKELGSADFRYDTERYYALKAEIAGPRIKVSVDDKVVLEASDAELPKGKAGITAGDPARFADFRVSASDRGAQEIARRIRLREDTLARLRETIRSRNCGRSLRRQALAPGGTCVSAIWMATACRTC